MGDLEQIKKRIEDDLKYIHIEDDAKQWRRVALVLIERLEMVESLRPELFTTQVRKPI